MSSQARFVAAVTALLLVSACGPANERPVRGAVPGTEAAPTALGLPPTLTTSEALRFRALPTPSPAVAAPASPSAAVSPSAVAAAPIVRTIVPGANAKVAAGESIAVSAVLVGRSADLATTSLAVDGADTGAQIDKRSPREWTIHTTATLATGAHTARVLVRDTTGLNGGFSWQFTVGDEPPAARPNPAAPTPAPKP